MVLPSLKLDANTRLDDFKTQLQLARTNKEIGYTFADRYSRYKSDFASDIRNDTIPKNSICTNQSGYNEEGCNKAIAHYRIKGILSEYDQEIPTNDVDIIPLLNTVLLKTIDRNNKEISDYLVLLGAYILEIRESAFSNRDLLEIYIPRTVIE